MLDGEEAVNVAQSDGRHIVGVGSWTGRRTALHCTANGKVLLAFGPTARCRAELEAFTPRTITRRARLERELAAVREPGYATNVGELEEGLHAVAAPVFDAAGACRAALSISGPSYRMPEGSLPEFGERCRDAAEEIGGLLARERPCSLSLPPIPSSSIDLEAAAGRLSLRRPADRVGGCRRRSARGARTADARPRRRRAARQGG